MRRFLPCPPRLHFPLSARLGYPQAATDFFAGSAFGQGGGFERRLMLSVAGVRGALSGRVAMHPWPRGDGEQRRLPEGL
jgi:hypothetical protein